MIVAAIETNRGTAINRHSCHLISNRDADLMAVARTMVMRDRLPRLIVGAVARRSVKDALLETGNLKAGSALQTGRRRLRSDDKRQRQNSPDNQGEDSIHRPCP